MRRFAPVPEDTTCRKCGNVIKATTPEDAATYHRETRVTFDETPDVFADYCSNGCVNEDNERLVVELRAAELIIDEIAAHEENQRRDARWYVDDMGREHDLAATVDAATQADIERATDLDAAATAVNAVRDLAAVASKISDTQRRDDAFTALGILINLSTVTENVKRRMRIAVDVRQR